MKTLVCFLVLLAGALGIPVKAGIGSRLLGGSNAKKGDFPSVVSLEFCQRDTCRHACAGAIIAESWVVTAAHCFTDAPGEPGAANYRVVAGIVSLDDDSSDRQEVGVSDSFVHSIFEGGPGAHDVAVLKLATPLEFNDAVQAIKIASSGDAPSGTASLVGWGTTEEGDPEISNVEQVATVPILSHEDCESALDELLNGNHPFESEFNICTGPLTGEVSTCVGDSGDPLIQDNTLLGIVSWAVTPCGTEGAPSSIETWLDPYRDWIESVIDEDQDDDDGPPGDDDDDDGPPGDDDDDDGPPGDDDDDDEGPPGDDDDDDGPPGDDDDDGPPGDDDDDGPPGDDDNDDGPPEDDDNEDPPGPPK